MRRAVTAALCALAALTVTAPALASDLDLDLGSNKMLSASFTGEDTAARPLGLWFVVSRQPNGEQEPEAGTLQSLLVDVECQTGERFGPGQPSRATGSLAEVVFVFKPSAEGTCVGHVAGTVLGKTVDERFEMWGYPSAAPDTPAQAGSRLPLLAGLAAVVAAAAAGGVFLLSRRRRTASAASLPAPFASGRYATTRFVGEGGMKRVYLAKDTRLDRDVALAVVKAELLDDASRTRVVREAQSMAKLLHPNVVSVFDSGEERGSPFIVAEYMDGGSVQDLVRAGRVPLATSLAIARDVCSALEHAHARGVVHRDVKPGNVWLDSEGRAKLGDFGLAAAADHSRHTVDGTMVGTVAYMSPEQARGEQAGERSDLYALGAMLFELICGRPPFVGDGPAAVIGQVLQSDPPRPSSGAPGLPKALDDLVVKLLSKDPDDRPESAKLVGASLDRIRRSMDPGAPAASGGIDGVAQSVVVSRHDFSAHAGSDGTVTLMFTDIESSTPMLERMGDKRWLEVLNEHDVLIRAKLDGHHGRVVDTAGDGFLAAFSSGREALRCAIDIQRELAARSRKGEPVRVRIGIHTGDAIKGGARFVGIHVHLAARVASQAKGSEILVSEVTRRLVAGEEFSFGRARTVKLKGIREEQRVSPVDWAKG